MEVQKNKRRKNRPFWVTALSLLCHLPLHIETEMPNQGSKY
jgi:hypothetical protein